MSNQGLITTFRKSRLNEVDRNIQVNTLESSCKILKMPFFILLGFLSAFTFFAMGFNGYSYSYHISHIIMVAIGSTMVGLRMKPWFISMLLFFVPHLILFSLLIMGSMQSGIWLYNLSLVLLSIIAIFLPALLANKLFSQKNRKL